MKQHTLNWLSFSIVALLLLFSCKKKQKGVLDNFPSGRFDFVCMWVDNGIQDTIYGEVSGPYLQSMSYYFRIRQELSTGNSWKEIKMGNYSGMTNSQFKTRDFPYIDSKIVTEEHDENRLTLYFQSANTLSGSIKLIRK